MALAHAGGIPEALSILVPIALAIVLLRTGAKKRSGADPDDAGPERRDPPDDLSR